MVAFHRVEIFCALRHLRARREAMAIDYLTLEERVKTQDIITHSALLTLSTEIDILETVIRRLWESTGPPYGHPSDPAYGGHQP